MQKMILVSSAALMVAAVVTVLFLREKPAIQALSGRFHTSMYYYNNTDFFSASLKPFTTTTPITPHPRIFITNQHVLAASLIAYQFALARDTSVTNVVLKIGRAHV